MRGSLLLGVVCLSSFVVGFSRYIVLYRMAIGRWNHPRPSSNASLVFFHAWISGWASCGIGKCGFDGVSLHIYLSKRVGGGFFEISSSVVAVGFHLTDPGKNRLVRHTAQEFSISCISTSERSKSQESRDLAHVFRLLHLASHRPQIAVQRASEKLQQHLEADAGESWVVAAPVILSVR